MQILIAGHIDFDPQIAESMLVDARPLIEAALAEPGCRAYSWALDPLTPGRVCVFERWDDEASLAAHFASAPYREMGAHLTAAGMLAFDVLKYRADLAEPVYDPLGIPRADFFSENAVGADRRLQQRSAAPGQGASGRPSDIC